MLALTLAEVAAATGGRIAAGSPEVAVPGVAVDSRRVGPGDLFVALRGERTDGHRFLPQAFAAGAAAALVSEDDTEPVPAGRGLVRVDDTLAALGRLARHHVDRLGGAARIVAVTGSVGKTSARELTAAALASRLRVLQPEANFNTEVGVPLTCFRLGPEHQAAVLEYAMRGPGQIAALCRICPPRVGVVTRIGTSHLEQLGSQERIARAKGELIEALPPDGVAILNRDDPWQQAIASRSPAPVVWYGFGAGAQVTARRLEVEGARGTRFRLVAPQGEAEVRLPLLGRHQVANALAAAAAGLACGLDPAAVAAGLGQARPAHGRLEVHELGRLRLIDDTYNAAPDSVLAALEVLGSVAPPERRVVVLADMLELGPASEAGHRQVGEAAARLPVRLLVAVGPQAAWIAEAARGAGGAAVHCADRGAAARLLGERLQEGDTVLVKGSRGMRMEEVAAAVEGWARAR